MYGSSAVSPILKRTDRINRKRGLLSHLLAWLFVSLKPPRIICLYTKHCISHSNCIHMEGCKVCSVFNSVADLDSLDA